MNKLEHHYEVLSREQVSKVEKLKDALYVGEFSLKHVKGGGWTNLPYAVFYQEEPHPRGSNYFGLVDYGDGLRVVDAKSAAEPTVWQGVKLSNGKILYSAYRHDFRGSGDYFVDGGPEYIRTNAPEDRWVEFIITKGKIYVV